MTVSMFITPILLLALLIYCFIKKTDAYGAFITGAKGAVDLAISILPFLVAIFAAVELFRVSGLTLMLADFLAPATALLGMPKELTELVLLRPFTGSGSLALLDQIFATHGPDSYIARAGSVILGSSETVFYVATVYFAQTKVKRLVYAVPVALLACLFSAIVACWIVRIM
ncbi:MAG: spore maturation protein [Firmicutes bacterium]|nr:spore maturation protein [Bacillota bacterium]